VYLLRIGGALFRSPPVVALDLRPALLPSGLNVLPVAMMQQGVKTETHGRILDILPSGDGDRETDPRMLPFEMGNTAYKHSRLSSSLQRGKKLAPSSNDGLDHLYHNGTRYTVSFTVHWILKWAIGA
jgi:hypothetical protein